MAKVSYDPVPETVHDALRVWDADGSVFTVEMGGLGPGYEQAIQVGVVAICRAFLALAEPPPADDKAIDLHVRRLADLAGKKLVWSGAQQGAAISLAYSYLTRGWRATVRGAKDREIQISRTWVEEPEL